MLDLDPIDRRLLNLLQQDASLTNDALAKRAHLSPATCLRRVRRLNEQGVIERQIALVAPGALAAGLTAILEVALDRQDAESLRAFESLVVAEPCVQQCYQMAAGPDFILVVHVPDMPGYQAFAQRVLTAQAHVRNVRAFFVAKRSKFQPSIAL